MTGSSSSFLQNKLGLLSLPWLTAHHDLFFFHLWPQVASFPYSWKSPLIAPEDMACGMGTDAPCLLFNGPSQKATYIRGLFKRGQGSCARWTGQTSNKKSPTNPITMARSSPIVDPGYEKLCEAGFPQSLAQVGGNLILSTRLWTTPYR